MIAQPQRHIEPHSDRSGNYWLAYGEAYGRTLLAEGPTRHEAIKEWTAAAADRQAQQLGIRECAL